VPEAEFLAACTRCDACMTACPYGVVVPAPPRFKQAAGTPMIDPASAACHMCPDTPCITACAPGVLRRDRPLKMGTAVIQAWNCLAHQNSFCTVCSEQCPVPGAIALVDGKPRVDERVCTGCGVCHYACPAPANAVMILPLRDRPPTRTIPEGDK
jgi:ferredoxin-type protein NapG